MRRKDRAVTDTERIKEILDNCKTCHLAMVDGETPYVIPLSYAYTINEAEAPTLTLFFHSAKEGRKIDILRKSSSICFEMCTEGSPIFAEETPCNSGYYFSSVHGFGTVQFVEDLEEKCAALTHLMKHQANRDIVFTTAQADTVCIFKVSTTDFTAKTKPNPAIPANANLKSNHPL